MFERDKIKTETEKSYIEGKVISLSGKYIDILYPIRDPVNIFHGKFKSILIGDHTLETRIKINFIDPLLFDIFRIFS